MTRRLRLDDAVWAVALMLVPQGACFMPRAAGEHLQVEMAALRHDVGTLERRMAESQAGQSAEVTALRSQVAAVTQTVGKMSSASRVADADMGSQLERMVQDVQMLRGAVEDTAHSLGETQSQQNKLTQELTARIAALQPPPSAAGRDRDGNRPSLSSSAQKALPGGKKERLAYGLSLLKEDKTWDDGANVLRDLARKYSAERGIGDEALFALGSAQVARKKYDLAQRDFIRLVDAQPKSPRVAEAFMRLADCSYALGRVEDAQTFLSEVVSNHRQSRHYRAAKTRLAALTAELARKKPPAAAGAPAPAP